MDTPVATERVSGELLVDLTIRQLLANASIELNASEAGQLPESRALLPPGTRIYISHLPKQCWQDTITASAAASAAGFTPVPHIPVRLMPDAMTLQQTLCRLLDDAGVEEVLLVAGDYPTPSGPYACVSDVLRSDALRQCGLRKVSFAGHPEGHPQVPLAEIRRAEREKAALAMDAGLDVTFLTQFFFEAAPFLRWSEEMRECSARPRIVAGLSGPAALPTLLKYAVRCGVGPSIRVLTARPASVGKLLRGYRPDDVLRNLAQALALNGAMFDGIHWFCFGGFLETSRWLHTLLHPRPVQ